MSLSVKNMLGGGKESYPYTWRKYSYRVEKVLPNGYTDLKSIKGTGTQYLALPIEPTNYLSLDYILNSVSDNTDFIGNSNDSYTRIAIWVGLSQKKLTVRLGSSNTTVTYDGYPLVTHIENNGSTLTTDVNGIVLSASSIYTGASIMGLGCRVNDDGTSASTIASFELADHLTICVENGIEFARYYPCSNPQGVVGLYDVIGRAFYSSSSTTGFVAGDIAEERVIITKEYIGETASPTLIHPVDGQEGDYWYELITPKAPYVWERSTTDGISIEYVVDKNSDTYPNGGVLDGFYYEKVGNTVINNGRLTEVVASEPIRKNSFITVNDATVDILHSDGNGCNESFTLVEENTNSFFGAKAIEMHDKILLFYNSSDGTEGFRVMVITDNSDGELIAESTTVLDVTNAQAGRYISDIYQIDNDNLIVAYSIASYNYANLMLINFDGSTISVKHTVQKISTASYAGRYGKFIYISDKLFYICATGSAMYGAYPISIINDEIIFGTPTSCVQGATNSNNNFVISKQTNNRFIIAYANGSSSYLYCSLVTVSQGGSISITYTTNNGTSNSGGYLQDVITEPNGASIFGGNGGTNYYTCFSCRIYNNTLTTTTDTAVVNNLTYISAYKTPLVPLGGAYYLVCGIAYTERRIMYGITYKAGNFFIPATMNRLNFTEQNGRNLAPIVYHNRIIIFCTKPNYMGYAILGLTTTVSETADKGVIDGVSVTKASTGSKCDVYLI